MREKTNNLLIEKDLLENEIENLKNKVELDKKENQNLKSRIDELEPKLQNISSENNKLKELDNFYLNEVPRLKKTISQLEKDKSSLELQLKNIEQNINQNEFLIRTQESADFPNNSSELVNGNFIAQINSAKIFIFFSKKF